MDEDGCPKEEQPFPPHIKILHRLAPLGNHRIHDWGPILGRGPIGRPYFLDDRELQWINPTMKLPLPQPLITALTYLRALLSSTDHEHYAKLRREINTSPLWDLSIAPRWRSMLEDDWSLLPDTPSLLALDSVTLQHSLTSAAQKHARAPAADPEEIQPKLVLHFPTPRQKRSLKR